MKLLRNPTLLLVALLTACAPAPLATPAPTATATATITATATATTTPTSTSTRTPPLLPESFRTGLLNPVDLPHSYITDACQYLQAKWSSVNSAPGTVVMVIMFHSITQDEASGPNQISASRFHDLIARLRQSGFEAITTLQLADFLEANARIPPRSVLLVVDDRHYAQYFNTYFRPYWEQYGWPVVNAWISHPETNLLLWQENEALAAEGWVDYQAHGVIHNIKISETSSEEYILGELEGAIEAFEQHFANAPIGFIWPLGGFTPRAVELARQAGYRLGFTVNPRGPLMFNWVPQSDGPDPQRPSYLPEGPSGDPLLTLPRYWNTDAVIHLQTVIQISEQAAAYAAANRPVELEYYDIVCASEHGPIP
ncbi:MAG: polysaccharide deacetylase family protein [Chloroflexota bacterium]